ncbi:MAG: adenylate/guanylate cyclase domain-containing protein [Bacteroidia bacterium]|nr:adenylate/guanylate cyclase domain-containing protein [Bacteroidia bacterium]
MAEETDIKNEDIASLADSNIDREESPGYDLRPWNIISQGNAYIIYLSVTLFAFYAIARQGFSWIALSTSLFVSVPIGVTIAYFESRSIEFRRKHRRYQFWFYLLYRTFRVTSWFIILFFIIITLVRLLRINTYETIFPHTLHDFFTSRKVFEFLGIALLISLFSNLLDELHRKLGGDAIFNLVFGKYHQVKQEDRLFLFIDLNDSTKIAEEMGEMEFSHFLQDYYYDISEPIARYFGSVFQYVGDEAVVTWPLRKGLKFDVSVRCFFAIQKQIRRYKDYYEKRYGRIPGFKAALHGGNVVVSEVGKYRSEIAYHGDVLNTTSRMLNKCHDLNADFLVSDFIIENMQIPKYLKVDSMGSFQLKGKQQEVALYSVYLSLKKGQADERKRRKGFFRKRFEKT